MLPNVLLMRINDSFYMMYTFSLYVIFILDPGCNLSITLGAWVVDTYKICSVPSGNSDSSSSITIFDG